MFQSFVVKSFWCTCLHYFQWLHVFYDKTNTSHNSARDQRESNEILSYVTLNVLLMIILCWIYRWINPFFCSIITLFNPSQLSIPYCKHEENLSMDNVSPSIYCKIFGVEFVDQSILSVFGQNYDVHQTHYFSSVNKHVTKVSGWFQGLLSQVAFQSHSLVNNVTHW